MGEVVSLRAAVTAADVEALLDRAAQLWISHVRAAESLTDQARIVAGMRLDLADPQLQAVARHEFELLRALVEGKRG